MVQRLGQEPSLERLVESGELRLEVLHPGGLEITRELAMLCNVGEGTRVLDVASGTGESACFLVENFHCSVVGVDISAHLMARARRKAAARGLTVGFVRGDAHRLPFADNTFDAVISECTLCLLDKERTIAEMARVAKPAGYVAFHDICWQENTPESVRERLAELEGERPETLGGWTRLFVEAGLLHVVTVDKSRYLMPWIMQLRKKLGFMGNASILLRVLRTRGIRGYRSVRDSERMFKSPFLGYGIVVGRKP